MKKHVLLIITAIGLITIVIFLLTRERKETTHASSTQTKTTEVSQAEVIGHSLLRPGEIDESDLARRLQERQDIKQEWMSGIQHIVQLTKDPEADEVHKFLNGNSFLVESFDPNSMRILEEVKGEYPLALLILTKKDLDKDAVLKTRVERFAEMATFSENPPMITMYPLDMSRLWRGIALLHEGSHALSWARAPHNVADRREYALEEVKAHEFENRLLTKLGGEAYAKLIEKEIARIKEIEDAQSFDPKKIVIVSRTEYNPELDSIFEKALTQQEKDLRQTHVNIHAQFTLIERRNAGDPNKTLETKARWYDALRSSNASEP